MSTFTSEKYWKNSSFLRVTFPPFSKLSYKSLIFFRLDFSGATFTCLLLKNMNNWAQPAALQFSFNQPGIPGQVIAWKPCNLFSDRWPQICELGCSSSPSHPTSPGLGTFQGNFPPALPCSLLGNSGSHSRTGQQLGLSTAGSRCHHHHPKLLPPSLVAASRWWNKSSCA